MASLRKAKRIKRARRDLKIAQRRAKKTRVRDRKQREAGALYL